MPEEERLDLEAAMFGILALLASEREERLSGTPPLQTEVILSKAGLEIGQIARVLGKNYQAVQKVLWRGRVSARRQAGDQPKESADGRE